MTQTTTAIAPHAATTVKAPSSSLSAARRKLQAALDAIDQGIDTLIISRNLGHANLATTDIYLRGFPQSRVISELRSRPAPKVSMFDMLRSAGVPVGDRPELGAGSAPAPDLMGVLVRA